MIWGNEQRAVVLAGPPPSACPASARDGLRPSRAVEVTVPGAADKRGPLGRGEHQGRVGGVPRVAYRYLAVGQVRDLDAVAPLRAAPSALAPRHVRQVRGGHSVTDAHSASPPAG